MICPACKTNDSLYTSSGLPSSRLCTPCFDILLEVLIILYDRSGLEDSTPEEEKATVEVTIKCGTTYDAARRLGADDETLERIVLDAAPRLPPRVPSKNLTNRQLIRMVSRARA